MTTLTKSHTPCMPRTPHEVVYNQLDTSLEEETSFISAQESYALALEEQAQEEFKEHIRCAVARLQKDPKYASMSVKKILTDYKHLVTPPLDHQDWTPRILRKKR